MTQQARFTNLADASERAIEWSRTGEKYAAIVLSQGAYFVETDPPFVRTWEELTGEYRNGELVNA